MSATGLLPARWTLPMSPRRSIQLPRFGRVWPALFAIAGISFLTMTSLASSRKLEVPRDWSSYVDSTSRRETCVRELVEDWQNSQGDVVRYSLRYDSPCEAGRVRRAEPTTPKLKVTVGMMPAAAARATREALGRVSPGRQ